MTTADVPVHLGEAITMEIQFLKEIIDGNVPTSMVLTRSNKTILKKILVSRTDEKFDYGEFLLIQDVEEDDDWTYIMMNDIIKSPRYWSESDFKEIRQ